MASKDTIAELESGFIPPSEIVERSELNFELMVFARVLLSDTPEVDLPHMILASRLVNQFLPKLPSGYSVLESFLVKSNSLIP